MKSIIVSALLALVFFGAIWLASFIFIHVPYLGMIIAGSLLWILITAIIHDMRMKY